MPSLLGYHLPTLRGVAEHLGLERVEQMARRPGVQAVYRVTVHYFDARASDSVATLQRTSMERVTLELHFQRALGGKPLQLPITVSRYETFVTALQGLGFDRLSDQSNLPTYNTTDVWLIERAAGAFSHSIIVAPELAQDAYARLVNAVKNGLPEALKQVK
jgi:hypothetical protein